MTALGLAADAAIPLPHVGPDDQIGRAGFVFDRHERHSLGGSRSLSHEHQPGDAITPVRLSTFCNRGCRHDLLRIQRRAQRGERMAAQR